MKSYTGTGYTIYAHINKVNGKMYIGQTKQQDLTRRWTGGHGYEGCPRFYRAIKKYGWDSFDHEIWKTGLTKEEADAYEKVYISFFESNNPQKGYNIGTGGHHSGVLSVAGRKRIVERFSGANSPIARPVVVFTCDGHREAEFDTVHSASLHYNVSIGSISSRCSSKQGTLSNRLFFFKEDVGDIQSLPVDLICSPHDMRKKFKPVAQYDLDGHFISHFSSLKEASAITGVPSSQISAVISSRRKQAGSFQWRTYCGCDSDIPPYIQKGGVFKISSINCNICKIDPLSDEPIAVYRELEEIPVGCPDDLLEILSCLCHRTESAIGFKWEYAGDYSERTGKRTRCVNRRCAVHQVDSKSGAIVSTFPSIRAASKTVNISKSSISLALSGNRKTAGGFLWEKAIRK